MDFSQNKPIYLQICDQIIERILSGESVPGERILSVRELGATLGVNPNTVMRSFEKLTADGIIYNKRGIGYFISDNAVDKVREERRKEFMEVELPQILKRLRLLGLDPEEVLRSGSANAPAEQQRASGAE